MVSPHNSWRGTRWARLSYRFHYVWETSTTLFARLWPLIRWFWVAFIVGGLLVNVFFIFLTATPSAYPNPSSWLFIRLVQTYPFQAITGLVLLLGLTLICYRASQQKSSEQKENAPSPFILAHALRRESFKLGDNTAANFPYISGPVQDAYETATQTLHKASKGGDEGKRGLLIIGPANGGKTRLALEVLLRTLPDWPVLRWSPAYSLEQVPSLEHITKRELVVLIDDLQDYILPESRGAHHPLLIDARVMVLRTLLETLRTKAHRVVVIATCRAEDSERAQAALDSFFAELETIELPLFKAEAHDPQAQQVIEAFQQQGAKHLADWDGTLGSLVLGLSTKQSQYYSLSDTSSIILQTMKLLTLAGITSHTERRIQATCAYVFGEQALQENLKIWRTAIEQLIEMQFVTEELIRDDNSSLLVIRSDTYFEKVITNYPSSSRPHQLDQDLIRLRAALVTVRDIRGLLNLRLAFSILGQDEVALDTVELALEIDSTDAFAYSAKSACLFILHREEEALVAIEQAIVLKPQMPIFYTLKATALQLLGRPSEALETIEQAGIIGNLNQHNYSFGPFLKSQIIKLFARHFGEDGDAKAIMAALETLPLPRMLDIAAYLNKALALESQGHYEEALAAFEHLVQIAPNIPAFHAAKGICLEECERYQEALAAYEQALALDPNNEENWSNKGDALRGLHLDEEALAAYDQAIKLNPTSPSSYRKKGVLLESRERYEEALVAYEQAITCDPNDAINWSNKADVLYKLHQHEAALVTYNHALELDPTLTSAHFGKNFVLISLNQSNPSGTSVALEAVSRIIELLPPALPDAFSAAKGQLLMALGRYQEALAAYEQAITSDPKDAENWSGKGDALRGLERYKEALNAYDQALEFQSDSAKIYSNKADTLISLNQFQEALVAYEQATALNPQDADTWRKKAETLSKLEHHEEALAAYEQVILLGKFPGVIYLKKAMLHLKLRQYEDAIASCERITDSDLEISLVSYKIKGIALERMKRYQEALETYEQAITRAPQDGDNWQNKGDMLKQLGRGAEAEQAYQMARELSRQQ